MIIYPQGMTKPVETVKPTETSKPIADAVKARIKAIVTKPMDADYVVEVLSKEGKLSGVVDVYALIEAVDKEWHPEKYAAVESDPIVEK